LANRKNQKLIEYLNQAVLELLSDIDAQRQPDWDPQAHFQFTATIVEAFTTGQKAFADLCQNLEANSIPTVLLSVIIKEKYSELYALSSYREFADTLKRALMRGDLKALELDEMSDEQEEQNASGGRKTACRYRCNIL